MKFIILGEMTTLNEYVNAERSNRFMGAKIKKNETERVYLACKQQKLKPIKGLVIARFDWYHKNSRKDFDNVEFAQKFIWDGLVLAKVLKTDGQKDTPEYRIHCHHYSKQPRVEVIME